METFRAITMISIVTSIAISALSVIGVAIYFIFHHKNIERLRKIFRVVTSISMIITIAVAALGIIGIAITGLYPGIIGLFLLTLIPIASKFYAEKMISKSNDFQRNYYITLTMINLLAILLVSFMTFVTVHDRIFHDCC